MESRLKCRIHGIPAKRRGGLYEDGSGSRKYNLGPLKVEVDVPGCDDPFVTWKSLINFS